MDAVQNLILGALREGTMTGEMESYTWEAKRTDPSWSDQWVMSVSIAPYNPEVHVPWFVSWAEDSEEIAEANQQLIDMANSQGLPTHMARVVFRTRWDYTLELVDGSELYLQVDESTGTVRSVWDSIWDGNQPDYYGGPIPEARKWVDELPGSTGEFYVQLDYPWSE